MLGLQEFRASEGDNELLNFNKASASDMDCVLEDNKMMKNMKDGNKSGMKVWLTIIMAI